MYLVVKDHKKEPGKSRPIVTGNSGNTWGLSNSVSNLLESVANSINTDFESISSEEMLHTVKESNKKIAEHLEQWREKRLAKLRCKTCKYREEQTTHICAEHCQQGDALGQDQDKEHTMETKYDCDACGREWRSRMEEDCEECGPGIYWEDQEVCLIGLDVGALFPSMKSTTTGKIIRQHVLKSKLKIDGFDWREGARYIVINKKYTGDLGCIWKVLPWCRKVQGTAP